MLFQDEVRGKQWWDEKLKQEINKGWTIWLKELEEMSHFRV